MRAENAYSKLVRGLKVVLPMLALTILATLFLLSDPPDPERAIPYAEVDVVALAREMRLTQPRYAGLLDNGREITLVADTATPDFNVTDVIRTDTLTGLIELDADDELHLEALQGEIDLTTRVADLAGDVIGETSGGYRITSDQMRLELTEFGMSTPVDVRIDGPGLELTAGAMDFVGPVATGVVSFTGGVWLLYEPER